MNFKKINITILLYLSIMCIIIGCNNINNENAKKDEIIVEENNNNINESGNKNEINENGNEFENIDDYVGKWQGQQSNLKINKISSNEISINYSIYQQLTERIAGFEIFNIKIDKNGKGNFTFENDGWFHKGNGSISLSGDKILFELFNITSTEENNFSLWGVSENVEELYRITDTQNDLESIENNEQLIYDHLICQKNTYVNVKENYKDNYNEIFKKYCSYYTSLGDSATFLKIQSNYEQYEQKQDIKILPYSEVINSKIAVIHENTYNHIDYDPNMPLFELTKIQAEKAIDYTENNIDENGYFEITGILIMNGNNTSLKEWKENSRAKKIKVTINDELEHIYNLKDTMDVQLIDLNYIQNSIEEPIDVKIEVLEKFDGSVSNDIYISDIRFGIQSSISGAR